MRSAGWLAFIFVFACGDDDEPMRDATPDEGRDMAVSESSVGGPCALDGDCRAGLTCFLGPDGARAWSGGYCTRSCERDVDCPFGTRCGLSYYDGSDDAVLLCLAECDRTEDSRGGCREGYACEWDGLCIVGCSNDEQCVTRDADVNPLPREPAGRCDLATSRCDNGDSTTAAIGDACTNNAECGTAPGTRCFARSFCTMTRCDAGGIHACPSGWDCIGYPVEWDSFAFVCAPSCTPFVDGTNGVNPDDACAPSFACVPRGADASDTATGAHCRYTDYRGSETAEIGDPCTSNASCPNSNGYGACGGACVQQYCSAPSLDEAMRACPAGSVCRDIDIDPSVDGRSLARAGELGVCLRDCSEDPGLCEGGTTCSDGSCI